MYPNAICQTAGISIENYGKNEENYISVTVLVQIKRDVFTNRFQLII